MRYTIIRCLVNVDFKVFPVVWHFILLTAGLYVHEAYKFIRSQALSWTESRWRSGRVQTTTKMCKDTIFAEDVRDIPRVYHVLNNSSGDWCHNHWNRIVNYVDETVCLTCREPFPFPWGFELIFFERLKHSEYVPYEMLIASLEEPLKSILAHGFCAHIHAK